MTESTLRKVAERFRASPEIRGKSSLGMLSEIFGPTDWLSGPGDDTAMVQCGNEHLLVGGEAIWPPLIEADPFAGGVASVVANVNDVAAMGGRCLALVDHVVAGQEVARKVLEGIHFAAGLYRVVVAGGHLTIWDGAPSVSASIVGTAARPLLARNVAPGQALLLACCLEGKMRKDFPFFSSIRHRGASLAGDVEILPSLAEAGLGEAAKDISMAGILGSLAMLLEATRCGVEIDLAAVPRPDGIPLDTWMFTFPTFAFLITGPVGDSAALCARFRDRDLSCEHIGNIDPTGRLMVRLGNESSQLLDLNTEAVTGLIRRTRPSEA